MEKWKRTLLLISIPFLLIPMIGQLPVSEGQGSEFETEPGSGVIDINGDEDLLDKADENGWIGSGNESDPIIIEGLDIDYPNGSMGLKIESTTLHIRISNCTFTEVPREIEMYSISSGILMENTKNIIIQNNSFFGDRGIPLYISESSDIEITGCDLSGDSNNYLFTIDTSDGINIRRNEFRSDGSSSGAEIYRSEDIEIYKCDFKDLSNGISMSSDNHISMNNNSITSIRNAAIVIEDVNDFVITNNTINARGMDPLHGDFYGWGIYTVSSEMGKVLNNTIESFSGITLVWNSGIVIRNNELNTLDNNLEIYACLGLDIQLNELNGTGIFILENLDRISFENNTLNGGPIFYEYGKDLSDVNIPAESQQIILDSVINASIRNLNIIGTNYPILIVRSSNIKISNCILSNCESAIYITDSDIVRIDNVKVNSAKRGIRLQTVTEAEITNNRVQTRVTSIELMSIINAHVNENDLKSAETGIVLAGFSDVQIIDNNINAGAPIDLWSSDDVSIINNSFQGGRISFQFGMKGYNLTAPTGNLQDGKPIHYIFHDCNVSAIPQDGYYTLFYNLTEKVISNLVFFGEVEFIECFNLSLLNLTFKQISHGLKISRCSGFELNSLEIDEVMGKTGLFLEQSSEVSIRDSNIKNCDVGIYINSSYNVMLFGCNVSQNKGHGIRFLNNSNSGRVENCMIGFNKGSGIQILSSDRITITQNEIIYNVKYGISISYSRECMIFANHFIKNNGILGSRETDRSQAYDMHQEDYWYIKDPETTQGNYWSDFTDPSLDEDNDGIIDVPYVIESEEGAQDMYPSLHRFDYKEKKEHYKLHGDDVALLISSLIPLVLVLLMIILTLVASFRKK